MDVRSPVRIRRPDPRELDRLSELWLGLLRHHGGAGERFAPSAEALAHSRSELARRLSQPDTYFHVAVLPRGASGPAPLAGFCIASILRRPALFRETYRGEIESLFVTEAARRRGYGTLMVEAALAWIRERGAVRVELAVDCSNPEGRDFWVRQGFAPAMEILERRL